MFDPSSFTDPTPLAHADTSRDVLPRGGISCFLCYVEHDRVRYYRRGAHVVANFELDLNFESIFLNETFITALWGTGVEKSFQSEEVFHRCFSYRQHQRTKDRVVMAQGTTCCHFGRVELQIRIREFQKTWEFHILNNMQYQCILSINFMINSKLTLDFDKKSLVIPDDQFKQLPIVEKPVEIDLSDTKLSEGQKQN
ncbi:uncharacterized protein TNCV_2050161 [Trichonephila clavipes]|nr:uncharacterized protein TNCV_2050161 [Trichonephila clavipes]